MPSFGAILRGFDRLRGMRRPKPGQLDTQPDCATAPPQADPQQADRQQADPQQADRQPGRVAAEIMRGRMFRRSMRGDGQGEGVAPTTQRVPGQDGYSRDRMQVQGRGMAGGFSPNAISRLRDRLGVKFGRRIKALYQ